MQLIFKLKKKTVSSKSMEASQKNICDELLRDENISIDDNSENVKFDYDKILISSVEESSKMQKSVKESMCLQK